MSKEGSIRTERALVFATAGVLALALGFSLWAITRSDNGSNTYLDRALESEQQLLRIRLTGLVHELEQALVLEGALLDTAGGPPGTNGLVGRWRPLLEGHWALTQVAIADEYGNETALLRNGAGTLVRSTSEGSQYKPSTIIALDGTDVTVVDSLRYDPRSQLWFSRALEDARDVPIWTIYRHELDSLRRLRLSLLLRAKDNTDPFHVVMFEADPKRISWLDHQYASIDQHAFLVLNSDGQILDRTHDSSETELEAAMRSAAARWNSDRIKGLFSLMEGERGYVASFAPYALNGQTLYTGAVLDTSVVGPLVEHERMVLNVLGIILIVLTGLLGSLWWRSRTAAAELREQERRSRSQELRLAKALGEREVLNREVHHRVKNNLQVVSSLLNLQAAGLDDGPVRDEFLRGKHRIDTIALVHHKLYALKDLRNVDLALFFDALTQAAAEYNEPQSHTVSFEVETQGLKCDQDTAIGLGIILCELMSNAFQHAFPYATGGHIDVQVQAVEGDLHRLVVKDNGKGLDPDTQTGKGKLGLEIVDALADQLDGSFHTRTNGGTTFEVLFRMRVANDSANTIDPEADSLQ